MSNDTSLVKPVSIASLIKKPGIQGAKARAQEAVSGIDPNTRQNRFAIGFDDSGSMAGDPISDAKKAVQGFLVNCSPMDTSVAIYPFCADKQPLTCIYDLINAYLGGIHATGGTPLYTTMIKMMNEYDLTRGILFSDGDPTDNHVDATPFIPSGYAVDEHGVAAQKMRTVADYSLELAKTKKVPFDTVYIGPGDSDVLAKIAEATGGQYLKFTDTSIFAKQMKYLAPKYYGLLSNPELKAKVEKGESV